MHPRRITPAARADRRADAFTLVELLVVIGIIGLLISILLPSMSKAREQARRTVCASNVRQFCMAQIMIANDNKGRLMDVGNVDHRLDKEIDPPNTTPNTPAETVGVASEVQVMHPAARDMLVRYGVQRKMFFCPSNSEMDTDFNWNRTDKYGYAFTGYMFLAGRTNLAKPWAQIKKDAIYGSTTTDVFEEAKTSTHLMFPLKLGQKAFYDVLAADTTRSYNNELNPSNHALGKDPTGFMPKGKGGANVGYLDGHVDWKPQDQLGQRAAPYQGKRQMYLAGTRYYF